MAQLNHIIIPAHDKQASAKFLADIPSRMYSDQNHAAFGLPGWNHDLWRHLRRLFELPWFVRTWIIQEVALSREDPVILHGQHS